MHLFHNLHFSREESDEIAIDYGPEKIYMRSALEHMGTVIESVVSGEAGLCDKKTIVPLYIHSALMAIALQSK